MQTRVREYKIKFSCCTAPNRRNKIFVFFYKKFLVSVFLVTDEICSKSWRESTAARNNWAEHSGRSGIRNRRCLPELHNIMQYLYLEMFVDQIWEPRWGIHLSRFSVKFLAVCMKEVHSWILATKAKPFAATSCQEGMAHEHRGRPTSMSAGSGGTSVGGGV